MSFYLVITRKKYPCGSLRNKQKTRKGNRNSYRDHVFQMQWNHFVSSCKKIISSKLVVVPYKQCHEAIAAYERQVNLRNLALAPALQGGLFLGASYFSSILYPVGQQMLSMQFWEGQIEQFQPSILLDTLTEGFFDASLGGVLYLIAPLCAFLSMRANFGTVISLKFEAKIQMSC